MPDFIKERKMADENKDNAQVLKPRARAKQVTEGQVTDGEGQADHALDAGDATGTDTSLTATELAAAEQPATNAPAPSTSGPQNAALPEPAAQGTAIQEAPHPGFLKYVQQMEEKLGAKAVEKIDVIVPKGFKITLDNNSVVHFKEGVQSVHRFLAEHWYAKANGMKEYKRPQGQVQGITPEVYTEAIRRVRNGDIKLAYAITNIATYYHLPEEQVRAEMDKQMQPA
jgi:hypothetical protein